VGVGEEPERRVGEQEELVSVGAEPGEGQDGCADKDNGGRSRDPRL